MNVLVTKAGGEQEPFAPDKLALSLERSGASPQIRDRILDRIRERAHEGMTTEEIYRAAFDMLRDKGGPAVAARYSVKRAIFALGPSGFPFEQFFAEVLRAHGWRTRTGIGLTGRCAPHEVDVLAEKDGKRIGIEAKFHNEPSGKTDIKDALYVRARYEDLARAPDPHERVDEGWLVTNTRFTRNAVRYARCMNLTLVAWDYPSDRGLHRLIEEGRVHPLTALTTLSEGEKRRLMDQKIVLCRDVRSAHLLAEFGVRPDRISGVLEEAKYLCQL
jgi:hypothetical protein